MHSVAQWLLIAILYMVNGIRGDCNNYSCANTNSIALIMYILSD